MSRHSRGMINMLPLCLGFALWASGCGGDAPAPAPETKPGGMESGKMGSMDSGKMDAMDKGKMDAMDKGKMDAMGKGKM